MIRSYPLAFPSSITAILWSGHDQNCYILQRSTVTSHNMEFVIDIIWLASFKVTDLPMVANTQALG